MKNLNFNKNSGKIVLVAVLCAIVITYCSGGLWFGHS